MKETEALVTQSNCCGRQGSIVPNWKGGELTRQEEGSESEREREKKEVSGGSRKLVEAMACSRADFF